MRPGRIFAPEEERAHVATHGIGILFILIAGPMIVYVAPSDLSLKCGLIFYALSFAFVFTASTLYHSAKKEEVRGRLRLLDHIAIYFFIAGSNAPYLLGLVDDSKGVMFFALMCFLVVLGTIYKLSGSQRFSWFSLFFYLLLGWLGLLTVYLVFPKISWEVLLLIITGGILYTIGTYFYKYDDRKWYHTIWHLFVLGGALAHYWAIYLASDV